MQKHDKNSKHVMMKDEKRNYWAYSMKDTANPYGVRSNVRHEDRISKA